MTKKFNSQRHKSRFNNVNLLALALVILVSFQNATAKAPLDFDGDGKTDYAILRSSWGQGHNLKN